MRHSGTLGRVGIIAAGAATMYLLDRSRGHVGSRLAVAEHPKHISDLQGGIPRTGIRWRLFQRRWSPAARVFVGGVSAGLIGYGIGRRELPASVLAFVGVGLLARSVWNHELREICESQWSRHTRSEETVHNRLPELRAAQR